MVGKPLIMTDIRKIILECLKMTFPDYVDKDVLKVCTKLHDNDLLKEVQYLEDEDCIELGKTKDPRVILTRITFFGARALSATDAQDDM